MAMRFHDRTEAGQRLATQLTAYAKGLDVLVLGLPRGGVPVAYEVAKVLGAPLDICLVRKLGVPSHPELAMGAIAEGGRRVLNWEVIDWLNISPETIEKVTVLETKELQRRSQLYRGDHPPPEITNRTVIVVDDGLATGSTMRAAIATLKLQQPKHLIVAVPLAPTSVCRSLQYQTDQVICLLTPEPFSAIGAWYDDFSQTPDQVVSDLLEHFRFSSLMN
jgi:putative phosphoribosyl transferase